MASGYTRSVSLAVEGTVSGVTEASRHGSYWLSHLFASPVIKAGTPEVSRQGMPIM